LIAAALLDGEVGPAQLELERILRKDVQGLLQKVLVRPDAQFTQRYPKELGVRITIVLRDGSQIQREQRDFEGSTTNPLSWDRVVEKFHWLAEPFADNALRDEIVFAVAHLEDVKIADLLELLGRLSPVPCYLRALPPM
jgi:2-methylcitrate dehydratase